MADTNPVSGSSSGSQKPSGLSWSTPPPGATPPLMPTSKTSTAQGSGASTIKPMSASSKSNPSPVMKMSSPSSSNNTSKMLGAVLGGIVIGGALMTAWFLWGGSATATPSDAATTTNTDNTPSTNTAPSTNNGTGISSGTSNLSVPGIQDAGTHVTITNATVSKPTWVAVYETINGQPARAIGATMFFPEYNGKGGSITLLRPMIAGQTYLVGQHIDSGDHVFSVSGDKMLTNAAGNPVWVTFKAR